MTSIQVVAYNPKYQQQVVELILPIQTEEFNVPITLADQPDLMDIAAFYQKSAGNFWVAIQDNRVVGSIALIDIGNGQGALRKMFVAKEYRGKQTGIAKLLLDTLLSWCHEKGIQEVYLGTVAILHAAQRFYEKNGFKAIAKENLPPNFPVMEVDSKFYVYREIAKP